MCICSSDSELSLCMSFLSDVSDGARIKYFVKDDMHTYIYKQNKIHPNGEYTFENVSELLFKRVCDRLSIPCVDITISDKSILSKVMWNCDIHSFIELSEELSHSFHMSNLQTYNIATLLSSKNPYVNEVCDMLLVDCLCCNSDRHPGNFGYNKNYGFYPLFDNGSSLCAYVHEEQIADLLRDNMRFNALCVTKSKPVLRDEQKLTHLELLQILAKNFPVQFESFKGRLCNLNVNDVLEGLPISVNRYKLLYKFLDTRKGWFYEGV